MLKLVAGRMLFVSVLCLGLTACGSEIVPVPVGPVVPAPAKTPPTTLDGNWLLTGSRVPATYPTISTTFFVAGNALFGLFAFDDQCASSGVTNGVGSSGLALG